jgi:hypothetical protein
MGDVRNGAGWSKMRRMESLGLSSGLYEYEGIRGKANRVRTIEESWNLWCIMGYGRHFLCSHVARRHSSEGLMLTRGQHGIGPGRIIELKLHA